MCQSIANGGARCAAHTRQEMNKSMATAKAKPSSRNNEALKAAMTEFHKTKTGAQELRARGDYVSVTLANKYDAERKNKRLGRKQAKEIAANNKDEAASLYDALYSSEKDAVSRHDENFDGFVFTNASVSPETGDYGKVPVTFKYDVATSWDADAGMLDGGTVMMQDLHNPDTLENNLKAQAKNANEAVYWNEDDEGKDTEEQREQVLTEQFGDNWENTVDVIIDAKPPYTADKVEAFHRDWIDSQELDDLDDTDLKLLSTHPLASKAKKEDAFAELEERGYAPFDAGGYNDAGFNVQGYDKNGFDQWDNDAEGYNVEGFNDDGFSKDGRKDPRGTWVGDTMVVRSWTTVLG